MGVGKRRGGKRGDSKSVDSIIGASLSEPHTTMTSLHTCLCMLACLLA